MNTNDLENFLNWIDFEKKSNCLYRVVDSNCVEHQKWIIAFNENVDYLTTEELYNFYNFITQHQHTARKDRRFRTSYYRVGKQRLV